MESVSCFCHLAIGHKKIERNHLPVRILAWTTRGEGYSPLSRRRQSQKQASEDGQRVPNQCEVFVSHLSEVCSRPLYTWDCQARPGPRVQLGVSPAETWKLKPRSSECEIATCFREKGIKLAKFLGGWWGGWAYSVFFLTIIIIF